MASMRSITLAALVAFLAILDGASARRLLTDSTEYYSPPKEDYSPPEYYSPPPPKEYYSPPKYYSPPPPEYEYKPPTEYSPPPKKTYGGCEEYAKQCDFQFLDGGVPTFHLIAHGDNAYDPIIVDKYNYPTKVLNPNGECKILGDSYDSSDSYSDDCRNFFYFQSNRVATRTFNIRPVEEFKGKCIRLEITSAQLWDSTNLNPYDDNEKYPEDRRCVVFHTA